MLRGWPIAAIGFVALIGAAVALGAFAMTRSDDDTSEASRIGLRDDAPDSQADLLADGEVTADELRTAVDRTIACLDGHGIEHTEPVLNESAPPPRWDYTLAYDDPEQEALYNECYWQHQRGVEAAWVLQHRPAASEEVDQQATALACASEHGIDVDDYNELVRLSFGETGDGGVDEPGEPPLDQLIAGGCLALAADGNSTLLDLAIAEATRTAGE